MPKIRLLLVDSSEIFREGLVNLIQSKSNIDAVSVSNKASQVVKAAKAHKPHVVLMDIESSEGSSIELIQHIHGVVPDACIVMFSHPKAKAIFFAAVTAGVTGYISKDSSLESLVKMITLAAEGTIIVDQTIAKTVVTALQALNGYRHEAIPEHISLLTNQERKVLALMAQDTSNKEIAEALFITEDTVKVHVHNIMHKLVARDRLGAAVCAIEEGLRYHVDGSRAEPM